MRLKNKLVYTVASVDYRNKQFESSDMLPLEFPKLYKVISSEN